MVSLVLRSYMIPRYADPVIESIFSDELKYSRWRDLEIKWMDEDARVPRAAVDLALATPPPTPEEVEAYEVTHGHDVVAFIRAWSDNMEDPDLARWVHYGLTSSDVVDPAHHQALFEAGEHITNLTLPLNQVLCDLAETHNESYRLGRTHGQWAEPTTFGYNMRKHAEAVNRAMHRFVLANHLVRQAKFPGAVGTASLQESLRPAKWVAGGQALPRDIQADWVLALIPVVVACENLAMEIRLSSRSEVGEVGEGAHRVGSSAMPHKRNPIGSEKVSGLARVARAMVGPILESVALHHDRDISNSSVERTALVDLIHITAHCITTVTHIMQALIVDTQRMIDNLENAGLLPYSSLFLHTLVSMGHPYPEAHRLVNQAMQSPSPWTALLDHLPESEREQLVLVKATKANPQWMCRWVTGFQE